MNNFYLNETCVRDIVLVFLNEKKIKYQHITHEPTLTSEDSARVRQTPLSAGIKSLMLKGKKTGAIYQFNLPSDIKLDNARPRELTGEKCEFPTAEQLYQNWCLYPGAVPPFGVLLGCRTFYDPRIFTDVKTSANEADIVAFNCGLRTESIIMTRQVFGELVETSLEGISN